MSIKRSTFNWKGPGETSWCSSYAAPTWNSWLHFICQTHINIVDGREDDGMQHVHFILQGISLLLRRVARTHNRCERGPASLLQPVSKTLQSTNTFLDADFQLLVILIWVPQMFLPHWWKWKGLSGALWFTRRRQTARVTAALGNIADLRLRARHVFSMLSRAAWSPGKAPFLPVQCAECRRCSASKLTAALKACRAEKLSAHSSAGDGATSGAYGFEEAVWRLQMYDPGKNVDILPGFGLFYARKNRPNLCQAFRV